MSPDDPKCAQSICIPFVERKSGCKETWGMYNNVCGRKEKSESQMCPATKMYGMTSNNGGMCPKKGKFYGISSTKCSTPSNGKSADGHSMDAQDLTFRQDLGNVPQTTKNNRILYDGRVNSEGLITVSRLPGSVFGAPAILAMMRAIAPGLTILPWELRNLQLPGVENLQCFDEPTIPTDNAAFTCCENCVYPGARGDTTTKSFGGLRNPVKSKRNKRTRQTDSNDERSDCENFVFKGNFTIVLLTIILIFLHVFFCSEVTGP